MHQEVDATLNHPIEHSATVAIRADPHIGAESGFSLSRIVFEHVIAGIRGGRYVPGQTLVAADLMKELGVSKAPVREALHQLVGEGVIELLPNRSVQLTRLDAAHLRDFIDVWSSLGGTSLQLAARAMSAGADGSALTTRLANIERAASRGITYEFLMSIADYHRAAASVHGNLFVQRFFGMAHFEHTYRHLASFMPSVPFREYTDRFAHVHAAVHAGDGDHAERMFREHMRWVARLIVTS